MLETCKLQSYLVTISELNLTSTTNYNRQATTKRKKTYVHLVLNRFFFFVIIIDTFSILIHFDSLTFDFPAYKTSFHSKTKKDTFEMFTMEVTPLKKGKNISSIGKCIIGFSKWRPYTLCGRFILSLLQGECDFQIDWLVEQLHLKFTPLWGLSNPACPAVRDW